MGKSASRCVRAGQEGTAVGGAGALPSRQQPNEQSGGAEGHSGPITWLQYISSLPAAAAPAHGAARYGLLGSWLAPRGLCPTHRHKSEEVSLTA